MSSAACVQFHIHVKKKLFLQYYRSLEFQMLSSSLAWPDSRRKSRRESGHARLVIFNVFTGVVIPLLATTIAQDHPVSRILRHTTVAVNVILIGWMIPSWDSRFDYAML